MRARPVLVIVVCCALAAAWAARRVDDPVRQAFDTLLVGAFLAVGLRLAAIDVREHRLPDAVVLPHLALSFVTVSTFGFVAPDSAVRASAGALALFGAYALIALLPGEGLGGGDVKYAAVVGLHLGWLGWMPLVVGALTAVVLGGIVAVALLLTRSLGRTDALPFGPFMLAGAVVGMLSA